MDNHPAFMECGSGRFAPSIGLPPAQIALVKLAACTRASSHKCGVALEASVSAARACVCVHSGAISFVGAS